MVKNVLVRGPLLSASGYGTHARQIFQFCESRKDWKVHTQILPWGITPWVINDQFEEGLYGRIMKSSGPLDQKFDISFQVQLPHEWDQNLAKFNIGVTAGVETDKCSTDWAVNHREKMNLLIVPSEFTKKTIVNSGTGKEKTPVRVVTEAFFSELLDDPDADPLANLTTQHNFLTIGTITADDADCDRKNLVNSILWFCEMFKGNKNVGLIIKASKGRDTTIDRDIVRSFLKQVKNKLGNDPTIPKLYMLHGSMTRKEMNNLYKSKKITGLISATHGEGFGLPLLEAAVAELPVVVTDWSAHTEFLSGKSFFKVSYDLSAVPQKRVDNVVFVKNALWANPRQGAFKRALRQCLDKDKSVIEDAKKLSDSLKKTNSIDAVKQDYQRLMDEFSL